VRSPLGECGSGAATLLLDLLHGDLLHSAGEPAATLRVETELVLRGSSGRLLPAG